MYVREGGGVTSPPPSGQAALVQETPDGTAVWDVGMLDGCESDSGCEVVSDVAMDEDSGCEVGIAELSPVELPAWQPGTNVGSWVARQLASIGAQSQVLLANVCLALEKIPMHLCKMLCAHLGTVGSTSGNPTWNFPPRAAFSWGLALQGTFL